MASVQRARFTLLLVLLARPSGVVRAQDFWLPAGMDSLRAAAAADSNDPVRHHAVALAYLNRRKLTEAENAFRAALAADPRYAPALFGLAVIALDRHPELLRPPGKKRPSEKLTQTRDSVFGQYRRAFLLDPLVGLSLPAAPVDTALVLTRFGDVEFAGMAAFFALLRGAYGAAFIEARWVLEQYDTYQVSGRVPSEVLWVYAMSGARLGRFEPGIRALNILVDRAEQEAQADTTRLPRFLEVNDLRYLLAFFRSKAGHVWSAINTYREVLVSDLGYWVAHERLGDLFESLHQWDEAVHEREQARELDPTNPMLQFELGVTLARAGRAVVADSVLAEAEAALPRMALIPYHRAELAWMRNDPASARAGYETFLTLAPAALADEIADAQMRLKVLQLQGR